MDFGRSFPLDPLPSGWRHRKFWTRSPMSMAFAVKDGVPSMRFETHDSASMLFRHVDIDLGGYPMLAWRWYIELPIRSPLDERTREGDDHPARLFLRFLTDRGDKRAMEVIWGNRLKPGDYKYIASFPHFVADAGDERIGHWLDERIDLARVCAEIWKDAAPAHLVDIAVFCDSDDTHTASLSSSPMSDSNGDKACDGALGRLWRMATRMALRIIACISAGLILFAAGFALGQGGAPRDYKGVKESGARRH
jgi:hypothetical protein